jgi:hypothetical protein
MKELITPILSAILLTYITFTALPAQTGSLEATILSRKGNTLELDPSSFSGEDYQTGTLADMSKHFEEKMGNMTMEGWIGVAKVKFIPTMRQNIEVEILEETSEITVNGEKVDHFKPGKRMKLEWPAKEEEKTQEDSDK